MDVNGLETPTCLTKRLPWDGELLTQPERHDEARSWFHDNMLGFRRGLEAAAPLIAF